MDTLRREIGNETIPILIGGLGGKNAVLLVLLILFVDIFLLLVLYSIHNPMIKNEWSG